MFTKASENFGVVQVVSTCQYVGIKIVLYVMLLCMCTLSVCGHRNSFVCGVALLSS